MATGGQNKVGYSLVKVGKLTLENTDDDPDYSGIVACRDKIIVIDSDACQVQLHRLQDGKLLCEHQLESVPSAICVINDVEIAVILDEGQIQIMAVDSRDKMATITSTRNLQVQGGFNRYDGVVKFKENLVVCGLKQETICWCVVSLNDGRVDAIHQICEGDKYHYNNYITTKDNIIYISCHAGDDSPDNGVYGFDILNPSQPKYTYKHKYLWSPGPIAINQDGFIYVCNFGFGFHSCIHQLTSKCQLVSIYRQGIPEDLSAIFWDHPHGHLYVTCYRSNDITIYKPEYTGVPIEILNMDDRSIQLFEEALKAGKENVYNIRVMVVGHLGVGKTTLIKRLLGEEVDISERHSTEGVDVHVNCCDVSLSTLKWTRRKKDSEQDYKLQRLVTVLNKNYQSKDKDADVSPPQRESNDSNPTVYVADCDNNTEELNPSSSQQDFVQNLSSTTSQQEESPSTVVQRNPTSSENNTTMPISELGENNASGSHQMDSVKEMLNLLQENHGKAIQDADKYAILTMWDFAGQYAFYTTHQMFLTRRAIYLLVSDVSGNVSDFVEDDCYFDSEGIMKCRVHELVEVWLNSIHSCAPPDKENMNSTYSQTPPDKVIPPPVILVGTHVDQIRQRQLVIRAEEESKQPQMSQTGMVTSTIPSNPALSREELRASTSQDPLQKSARLQQKIKATEQVSYIFSKKGLPCSDPKLLCQVLNKSTQIASSSRSILERNCQTVGLTFHGETPRNGNCFFEAVSSQLQRLNCTVQMSPQELRQHLVAFLKANRLLQVSTGNVNFAEFVYDETYDKYCVRMAQDGEWADHVVVVAMARMLLKDIVIVTSAPSSSRDDIITWVVGQPNFQEDPILLGHEWENHYESLQPIGSTDLKDKAQMQAVEKKGFDENETKNLMNTFGNYGGHSVVPGFAGGYNPDVRNRLQYDAQAPRNPMNTFGNYGGHSVVPGFAGGYNPDVRNRLQYDAQAPRNPMNTFGNYGGHSVVLGFAGGYNPDVRNHLQCDAQAPRNPMNTFGNYGGHSVVPGFAGGYNPDVRNRLLCDAQAPRNPMNTFGNYGGHSVVPGFAGGYNPDVRNRLQCDAQAPRNPMNTFGNYGGHSVVPGFAGGYNPDVRNHLQYDAQAPRNPMNTFGNYGGHSVVPGFAGGYNPGVRNPFQYDAQAPRDYCRKLGQRYLREIRSYLRDKPTTVHLVDEDFAIDNTVVDIELEELKRKIIEVASQQPYWGEEIPTRWLPVEQKLMKLKDAGVKLISRSTVEDLNKEGNVRIENGEELDLFLRYLHETGTIIYFSIEVLRENIVLDPKWLIDALKSLINAQPSQPKSPADNGTQSDSPADSTITQKWSDFKEKGILTLEFVDAVWTKEKHPELHAKRDYILQLMEQLNIIAKPRSFNEIGEKVENYFLTPCMLHQRSPKEVISPEHDPRMVSTSVLCCVFTENFLPPPIFHRLLAACVAHWPVAKKKETSEYLIFCGCCVFDLGLFHRLTLHYRNHVVFARITRMVVDEVKTPDAKLCTRVRKFITLNLSKITSYLGQNLQYEMYAQCPPSRGVPEDGMVCLTPWFADEGHDPEAPITREHMNHARLCVALVTVCGNALREILLTNFPGQYKDIYQAILANRVNLTKRQGRPLLNPDQIQLVFPDPQGQKTGTVDQFDLSLLYTLIRNVSTVPAPITGWGSDPQDQPRDNSLGASVERIRSYRNHISGHSPDGKISQQDFEAYWNKFDAVLCDIETVIGRQVCSLELEKQKSQVISIYEAC